MEIKLETGLQHQQKAIDAIMSVFNNVSVVRSCNYYENPSISPSEQQFEHNVVEIQKNIRSDYRNQKSKFDKSCLHIDVKMETGTGKTYVYTKTIYEMHKRLGFNRFIIVVPSLAIKTGVAQFIKDPYVQKHFADTCGYNSNIQLEVLESQKSGNKGRSTMPNAVRDFVWSDLSSRKIYVLLVNMQMLTNGKLLKTQYDQTLFNDICQPFEALRATKPVVIIDEPHRFSKNQSSYRAIMEELKPQILIRFGATFPEIEEGKGKNKLVRKDFTNLVYDLNACDSFNQGLIKGIIKEHINLPEGTHSTVKIVKIQNKTSVELLYKNENTSSTHELKSGDALSMICNEFTDIYIDSIGSNFITLSSNPDRELYLNEIFYPDIYSTSYQEQMLKLALDRHFETEIENFSSNIKTLALFFISDISSYRQTEDSTPFLKNLFEDLLRTKIKKLLEDVSLSNDYKKYLEASYNDISACHAGYFAQDNTAKKDDVIAKEVDDILRNKKALLSFKNEDGTYNTRRFLFSKWTLKEGWDNPNVFTIAKLRSSGSEISKLQEVGRGLRLPVNNAGNRISNGDFKLNYIVDFSESDFADKLVGEINGEIQTLNVISDELLQKIAKDRNIPADDLFTELLVNKFIDRNSNIIAENREKLLEKYPGFNNGLKSEKIIDKNKVKNKQTAKIKKTQFNSLKDLWNTINQKYYIFFNEQFNELSKQYLAEILNDNSIFSEEYTSSERYSIETDNSNKFTTVRLDGVSINTHRTIPYNQFLKSICHGTSIPITVIHQSICDHVKKTGITPNFTETSVAKIISKFKSKKVQNIDTLRYVKSNIKVSKTALTDENGQALNEIGLGRIGVISNKATPPDNYLYDKVAYDSPLEEMNITQKPNSVTVYGKIPRASISIPTILGENYSPDFMYVVQSGDTNQYNLVIETKDVETADSLRDVEKIKINCAKKFFETLSKDNNIEVKFQAQLKRDQMQGIIDELLN